MVIEFSPENRSHFFLVICHFNYTNNLSCLFWTNVFWGYMQHVNIGDIYDQSKVVRVDRGFGLLLDIPSKPVSTPAYVNVCVIFASVLFFIDIFTFAS